MKALWKIAIVAGAVVISGTAISWRAYRAKGDGFQTDLIATHAGAEQGDAKAEYKLGSIYYDGRGVPQDLAEALRWYRKAAAQGDPKSEYAIGYMYDTGHGVQQDNAQAYSWYQRAANQGDGEAECGLGSMYYHGHGVPRDWTQAALWYRRAAEGGLARGQYDLGYMYDHGLGVPRDQVQARLWFRRAAEQGDERARRVLGLRLSPMLVMLLAVQAVGGVFLLSAEIPYSLNIWEPNERSRRSRDWILLWIGCLCLFNAGASWYGYKHSLIWCWVNGITGFTLFKWTLDAIELGLVIVFVLKTKKTAKADQQIMSGYS